MVNLRDSRRNATLHSLPLYSQSFRQESVIPSIRRNQNTTLPVQPTDVFQSCPPTTARLLWHTGGNHPPIPYPSRSSAHKRYDQLPRILRQDRLTHLIRVRHPSAARRHCLIDRQLRLAYQHSRTIIERICDIPLLVIRCRGRIHSDVFTYAPTLMSMFFTICGDQLSHMLSDIHAAESLVADFVIFNECPIDRDWSVAQVIVAPQVDSQYSNMTATSLQSSRYC